MFISPENLSALKEPFGLLLEEGCINKERIYNSIEHTKLIISVGDATTDRLNFYGIIPDVCVVDGIERRVQRRTPGGDLPLTLRGEMLQLKCSNPAGIISERAVEVLRDAIKNSNAKPVRVIVEGEEDLLTLPIIVLVPLDSVILYGQPLKGIVIVKVDSKTRKRAKDLMQSLGIYWIRGYDDAVAV